MNIKKGILLAAVSLLIAFPAFAEREDTRTGGHTTANITYQTAPVYKVLDSTNNYVVLYGKYGAKIGTVTIPKKWAKWQKDTPRKLQIRELPNRMNPFITVVQKDGEFLKVMLTIPTNRLNSVWGIASNDRADGEEPEKIELELR